ncbi:NACHT domain- and WD repeat-containing protein 1-like isoform X2 [Haliotis rufescens]|uniref:NACHT domain- and WD repeat-containing protein 1-like isoform X2 n=1 Tax=Haliotis rufescens TaxID=6454 RepID=UPI00201F8732|nr:NACHT domain- and WD repeat-containing protein 1-like isoform X2 [Haliotis rufescens]
MMYSALYRRKQGQSSLASNLPSSHTINTRVTQHPEDPTKKVRTGSEKTEDAVTTKSTMSRKTSEQKSRRQDGRHAGRPGTSHRHRDHPRPHGKTSATDEVIRGNVTVECPSTAKIVRIFTSSTFTDTRNERNALMESAYPTLKEVCQQQGYEFQVVDMRWGVRDEATDDHMGTELCLREIDLCKKLSTGPNFVTFLSHKYGYRDFPNKIEATEFDKLFAAVEDEEALMLLKTWFKRDDNAVPPTYFLQPISSILPDFRDENEEKRKSAKTVWYDQNAIMQEALVKAANKKLDTKAAHRYVMSVTEAEITRGIVESEDRLSSCLWFHRHIDAIDKQEPGYILSRYKECLGPEERIKESQDLLSDLRDKILPTLLPSENHKTYNVEWTDDGVDPAKNKSHEAYIKQLCQDFTEEISKKVMQAIENRKRTDLANPLYGEIVEHTVFCQSKCKAFHGRQETLDLITKYLRGTTRTPFIVHGPSGCGKTSIVAIAATLASHTFGSKVGVVIRFIGTTPDSSSIGALLSSVTSQIWRIYGKDTDRELPPDIKELTPIFHEALNMANSDEPLVLLLDSLDQFDPSGGARQLFWLPEQLPDNVKMILSTLPEPQYETFPRLQEMYSERNNFLKVPKLADNDVDGILNKWLNQCNRVLTEQQRQTVLGAFQKCPLPLFLKLSFDEACRWSSFASKSETTLYTSIRGSINALFSRVEGLHGKIFVSRVLAYLTLSKTGLTESELEDILSCDDDVLNDVYMYWTPPVRRLPPLLLVRLKADLGQYLMDRGADGVRVFFWYHRQFIEAATDRYCSDPQLNQVLHGALADFFAGTWANGKAKAYLDKKGNTETADRRAATQPDKFKTGYNLRKLNNLPHQRTEAKQLGQLKQECLLNFAFLLSKLQASGLRPILEDFIAARNVYPGDHELKTVGESLQLSQDALVSYPNELPSQFLGRIKLWDGLEDLLAGCRNAPNFFLEPDRPVLTEPGGQLVNCLAEHQKQISGIDMTNDSNFIVTCAYDRSVKVWDVASGKLVRSIDAGEDPETVLLCCDDSVIIVHPDEHILGYDFKTGALLYDLFLEQRRRSLCVGGKNNSILGTFYKQTVSLYAADKGTLIGTVVCSLLGYFQKWSRNKSLYAGSLRYMAVAVDDHHWVCILDLETSQFIQKKEIFERFRTEDGGADQYSVDTLALSLSGHRLYLSGFETGDLYVYNTNTMEQETVYPGSDGDTSDKFKITKDGKTVYTANIDHVVLWDLQTGNRSTILQHGQDMTDVVMMDMTTAASYSDDRVVRIWDLTREAKTHSDEQEDVIDSWATCPVGDDETDNVEDENKAKPIEIKGLKTLPNPRYVLLKASRPTTKYLQVYDLLVKKVVRHIKVDLLPSKITPLEDSMHILIPVKRRLKVVDLSSATLLRTFEGKLPKHSTDFSLVANKKEVATFTRGYKGIKLYDLATGKTLAVMEAQNTTKFKYMTAGEKGTVLVAAIHGGPCYVFDIPKRTCLHKLNLRHFNSHSMYIGDVVFTNDDAYLVFEVKTRPQKAPEGSRDVYMPLCWDIQRNCIHKQLVDYEYYLKAINNGQNVSKVDAFQLLDNRTIAANYTDALIRVFDLHTGEVKKRLEGHLTANFSVVKDGPFLMSHGIDIEDNVIKMIDRTTFETRATFSLDYEIQDLVLTEDGYHAVGYFNESKKPVLWSLMGGSEDDPARKAFKPLSSFPDIYGPDTVQLQLQLEMDTDEEEDPDDLDKDIDDV